MSDRQPVFHLGSPSEVPNNRKVQLSLTYAFGDYKVVSVTNTTVVQPGQILQTEYVKNLCDNYMNWEITMVDPDIAGHIFNFIKSIIPIPAL